jgi:hypothetical protein
MLNKTGALRKNRFYHNAPFSILIFTRVFPRGLILISKETQTPVLTQWWRSFAIEVMTFDKQHSSALVARFQTNNLHFVQNNLFPLKIDMLWLNDMIRKFRN